MNISNMGIYFLILISIISGPFYGLQKKKNFFAKKLGVQESVSIKSKPKIECALMPKMS